MKSFSRKPRRALATRQPKRGRREAATTVVGLITDCIADLTAAGYAQTAEILAIARLDLLAKLHGVSDEELESLITAKCEAAVPPDPVKAPRPSRRKKTGKKPVQNKSR